MKRTLLAVSATVTVATCAFGAEDAALMELAKTKNCLSCHSADKKIVGPAFRDVAAKYKGNKDALATLSQKVLAGGAGVWGVVPMPANSQVSDADAKKLVAWVLSIR